jgi:hypothetical protein
MLRPISMVRMWGFLPLQTRDVAGSLRKLPYPRLNPVVNCVGFSMDKVELEVVFFSRHILFSLPFTIHKKMSCTHMLLGDH